MPVVVTYEFVDGTTAEAAQVNQNFEDIAGKFNGNITDGDIAGAANIAGSKIADATLPGAKLVDADLAGGKLAALIAADLARILPNMPLAGIGTNKLKLTVHEVTFSIAISTAMTGASTTLGFATGLAPPAIAFPVATHALLGIYLRDASVSGAGNIVWSASVIAAQSGGNWTANIAVLTKLNTAGGLFAGTLAYVFGEKA
jgi:hypothetical protein